MAIFNTNEFLRKTFSKTIFGTAALRPEAVCADGFTLSIQANDSWKSTVVAGTGAISTFTAASCT